ncbi:Hypothetical protein DHA2_152735 [Giardia duodenalis]|uniref:Uncharacterized protein n=1 Tax=Giardia intestinalis TaxID=5741 RepID=V6TFK0_GIAIN|nr:Hypothetical protein DHA2_152735 [Giardia intestinalis]
MGFGHLEAQRKLETGVSDRSKMKSCSCVHPLGTNDPVRTSSTQELTAYGTQRPSNVTGVDWTGPITGKPNLASHRHGIDLQEGSNSCIDNYNQYLPESLLTESDPSYQAGYTRVLHSSSSRSRVPTQVFKLALDRDNVMCPYLYETYKYALNDMANRKIATLTRGLVPAAILSDKLRPTSSYAPVRVRYHL